MSSIKIEGLEKLNEKLEKLANGENITQAIETACAVVERDAKTNAPSGDTGDLRRSISSRIENKDGEIIGVVYSPLEYAPYVEFGTGLFAKDGNGRKDVPWFYKDDKGNWHITSGMKPQPFLFPALNDNRDEIIQIIKEGFAK